MTTGWRREEKGPFPDELAHRGPAWAERVKCRASAEWNRKAARPPESLGLGRRLAARGRLGGDQRAGAVAVFCLCDGCACAFAMRLLAAGAAAGEGALAGA
jgi:hypothetical protein